MLALERIGCAVVQRRVWSSLIVERQVSFHPVRRFANAVVGMEIHLCVFHAPPGPFDEYVIPPAAWAIHAHALLAGALTALVGIEDVLRTVPVNRFLHGVQAEVGRERVGPPPRQHPTTGPVQNREQAHNATRHRKVRDIRRPDLVGAGHRQMADPIRVHPMRRMPRTGGGRALHRMEPHPLHPRRNATSAHRAACTGEHHPQHACAGKRTLQMELVDPAHPRQIL